MDDISTLTMDYRVTRIDTTNSCTYNSHSLEKDTRGKGCSSNGLYLASLQGFKWHLQDHLKTKPEVITMRGNTGWENRFTLPYVADEIREITEFDLYYDKKYTGG